MNRTRFPRKRYNLGLTACPSCGETTAVFLRAGDNLVCQSCRERMTATRHYDGGEYAQSPRPQLPARHLARKIP